MGLFGPPTPRVSRPRRFAARTLLEATTVSETLSFSSSRPNESRSAQNRIRHRSNLSVHPKEIAGAMARASIR